MLNTATKMNCLRIDLRKASAKKLLRISVSETMGRPSKLRIVSLSSPKTLMIMLAGRVSFHTVHKSFALLAYPVCHVPVGAAA